MPAIRTKKRRFFLRLLLVLAVLGLLGWRLERNLTDVVLSLANARAMALAVTALNEAADEVIRKGVTYDPVSYTHLTLPTKA